MLRVTRSFYGVINGMQATYKGCLYPRILDHSFSGRRYVRDGSFRTTRRLISSLVEQERFDRSPIAQAARTAKGNLHGSLECDNQCSEG